MLNLDKNQSNILGESIQFNNKLNPSNNNDAVNLGDIKVNSVSEEIEKSDADKPVSNKPELNDSGSEPIGEYTYCSFYNF